MACLWHPVSLAQKSGWNANTGRSWEHFPQRDGWCPLGGAGSEWRQRRPFHVTLTLVTMLMHTLCCKPQGRDRLGEACRDALVWGLE